MEVLSWPDESLNAAQAACCPARGPLARALELEPSWRPGLDAPSHASHRVAPSSMPSPSWRMTRWGSSDGYNNNDRSSDHTRAPPSLHRALLTATARSEEALDLPRGELGQPVHLPLLLREQSLIDDPLRPLPHTSELALEPPLERLTRCLDQHIRLEVALG